MASQRDARRHCQTETRRQQRNAVENVSALLHPSKFFWVVSSDNSRYIADGCKIFIDKNGAHSKDKLNLTGEIPVYRRMNSRIIIRFTDGGVAAYSPDYPELTSTGHTVKEVESKLGAAIETHLQNLREQTEKRWQEFTRQYSELAF